MLGFLGLIGIRGLIAAFSGDWVNASWMFWFVWFIYFIPITRKKK